MQNDEQPKKKLLEMREDDEPKKKGLSANAKKEIREWIVSLAVALVAVFLIRTFLFTVIQVSGPSMNDTLTDGDRMIVTIIDYKLNGARRGDVVICHYPNRSEQFVKRVIGVGGDTVEMKDGVTYVNGAALNEPYIVHVDYEAYGPFTVPEGEYFVMGDNRPNSNDSRFVGTLTSGQIVGIVKLILWPIPDIGLVPNGLEGGVG